MANKLNRPVVRGPRNAPEGIDALVTNGKYTRFRTRPNKGHQEKKARNQKRK
jgi:hypothetical protein